jgi:hypothetical protein
MQPRQCRKFTGSCQVIFVLRRGWRAGQALDNECVGGDIVVTSGVSNRCEEQVAVKEYDSVDEFPINQGKSDPPGGTPDGPEIRHHDAPPVTERVVPRATASGRTLVRTLVIVGFACILSLNFLMWRRLNITIEERLAASDAARDSSGLAKVREALRPFIHAAPPVFSLHKTGSETTARLSYIFRNVGMLPGSGVEVGSWMDSTAGKVLVDRIPVVERLVPVLYPNEEKETLSLAGEFSSAVLRAKPYLHIAASYLGPDSVRHRMTEIYYCSVVKSGAEIESALVWSRAE